MLEITERPTRGANEHIAERHRLAQEIATEAGKVALEYFRNRESLVVETKNNPQDLVSIADREVENLIGRLEHGVYT